MQEALLKVGKIYNATNVGKCLWKITNSRHWQRMDGEIGRISEL